MPAGTRWKVRLPANALLGWLTAIYQLRRDLDTDAKPPTGCGAQRSRSEPHVQDRCSPNNHLQFRCSRQHASREAQTLDPTTPRSSLNRSTSWNGSVPQRRDGATTPSRRKPSIRTIYAACVLTLAASTAAADTKTIATAGGWIAFAGRDEESRPICGVRASDPENSPNRRVLMVKWWSGGGNLAIQAAKVSWRIPPGTQMRMTLRFDSGTPLSGTGQVHANRSDMMHIDINPEATLGFIADFVTAKAMTVSFPDGLEHPWNINMHGSGTTGRALVDCISTFNRIDKEESRQPFAPGPPSTSSPPAPVPQPTRPERRA
jgi:hypothetical protein